MPGLLRNSLIFTEHSIPYSVLCALSFNADTRILQINVYRFTTLTTVFIQHLHKAIIENQEADILAGVA